MSKAIIVVELPDYKNASDFRLDEVRLFDKYTHAGLVLDSRYDDGIMLIEFPERKNEEQAYKLFPSKDRSYTNGVSDGYNACIDDILLSATRPCLTCKNTTECCGCDEYRKWKARHGK